jgi:protein arginine kinase activator
MKCQRCTKAATLHITEVTSDSQFEELHLCEECAQKYLYEPQKAGHKSVQEGSEKEGAETAALNNTECPLCGIKFQEFRSTGRLGCPNDYEAFREQLLPLLENIHGDIKHVGKTPRRSPRAKQVRAELSRLRKQLHEAITGENYEQAASLRDQIRRLEE